MFGLNVQRFRDWPLGRGLGQCRGGLVGTLTGVFDGGDLSASGVAPLLARLQHVLAGCRTTRS